MNTADRYEFITHNAADKALAERLKYEAIIDLTDSKLERFGIDAVHFSHCLQRTLDSNSINGITIITVTLGENTMDLMWSKETLPYDGDHCGTNWTMCNARERQENLPFPNPIKF